MFVDLLVRVLLELLYLVQPCTSQKGRGRREVGVGGEKGEWEESKSLVDWKMQFTMLWSVGYNIKLR